MKITIKINGAEVILEAQKPDEIVALGPLAASILEHSQAAPPKRARSRTNAETDQSSELAQERLRDVAWVLSTNQRPMNAPEVSAQVKDLPSFYTKGGEAVHVVRRVLAEGIQLGLFLKTAGGLFIDAATQSLNANSKAVEQIETEADALYRHLAVANPFNASRYSPPADDDLDDPFADN